jgi:hypothetical protein
MKDLFYILMFTKHLAADFSLQTLYMLGKGKPGLDFILPLSAHCAVHAGLSLVIILLFNPSMYWLAGVEFVLHFTIDRLKCLYKPWPAGAWSPELRGKYLSQFYTAFGVDQWAHAITYIGMGYLIFN